MTDGLFTDEFSIEYASDDDLCVIIRQPIEEFGIERCQQIEKELDKVLVPLGFNRIGSDKTNNQIFIRFKCFAVALQEQEA